LGLRDAQGVPTLPAADSSPAVREVSPLSATFRGTCEVSRGTLSYRPCIDAGLIKHSPCGEGFAVVCPRAPTVPHFLLCGHGITLEMAREEVDRPFHCPRVSFESAASRSVTPMSASRRSSASTVPASPTRGMSAGLTTPSRSSIARYEGSVP